MTTVSILTPHSGGVQLRSLLFRRPIILVSILTPHSGGVQRTPVHDNLIVDSEFQSSPRTQAGCNLRFAGKVVAVNPFQSSPRTQAGCNVVGEEYVS